MNIKEERISIPGSVSIGATVSYTDKGKCSPAVVLIMGTGKLDRDGNMKGYHMDFYKNLAELFADHGFVCIRYDKRGTYETGGVFKKAGLSDFVDDAVSVTRYVKALPFVDKSRVIICGHSEGTMISTLLTKQEETAGLLLLGGGSVICLKEAIHYQNRLLNEQVKHKKGLTGIFLRSQTKPEKAFAKVETMFQKSTKTDKDTLFYSGSMMNARWLREHGSNTSKDYASILQQYNKPILAITGTADLSVDYKTLDALADMDHAETFAPDKVNHIFREIDDDNSILAVKKQYIRLAKQPIHSKTAQKIKEWLNRFMAA